MDLEGLEVKHHLVGLGSQAVQMGQVDLGDQVVQVDREDRMGQVGHSVLGVLADLVGLVV